MASRWIRTSCPACFREVKAVEYGNPAVGWVIATHGPMIARCPGSGTEFGHTLPQLANVPIEEA